MMVGTVDRLGRTLAPWLLVGCIAFGCAPTPSSSSSETPPAGSAQVQSAEWRALYAAAGLPDITDATRVVQYYGEDAEPWMGGWRIETPEGPMLVTDDLAVQWEGAFYERVPLDLRVSVERYVAHPPPLGFERERFDPPRVPNPMPPWSEASADEHFDRLVALDDLPWVPYHLPSKARWEVVQLAHVRWAEMKGRTDVAQELIERRSEPLPDVSVIRDQMAEWLLEQGKWGMVHGMPRDRVARYWRTARSLQPASSEIRDELQDLLARIGRDAPTLPAVPREADWVARLPEDVVFPGHAWEPIVVGGEPWMPGGMQPVSPAWELVERGWPALPVLREVMDSEQLLRQGGMGADSWGAPQVRLSGTVGDLARSVASTIAQREFSDSAQFDAWWRRVGHRGRSASAHAAVFETERRVLERNISIVLEDDADQAWMTLEAALRSDGDVGRESRVLVVLRGLFEFEEDLSDAQRERHRDRYLETLRRLLEHPDVGLQVEVVLALAGQGERGAIPTVARRVRRALESDVGFSAVDWTPLADVLLDDRPALAIGLLRAGAESADRRTRQQASWVASDRCGSKPRECPRLRRALGVGAGEPWPEEVF